MLPLMCVPDSMLCPVKAYKTILQLVPAENSSPAFVVPVKPDGHKPIMYPYFHQALRKLIEELGLDSKEFSSHSFRHGGASHAFKCGVPSELIQLHGDWSSDCNKRYLQLGYEDRVNVAKKLATSVY